ncbi:hypothetical protein ACI2K4_16565 [Micromonospora sp. NPDC050397]|uniref:hypothetical protein n=1 Tax=Micromonospora sp. NPDC050397 TaxID=3364279 RepID=UPI003851827D
MLRNISRKTALGGLAAAGALAVGIAVPTVAFADDPTPAPSSSATTAPAPATDDQGGKPAAAGRGAFAEDLAKELGIPTDKVTAALDKVREQHRSDAKPENWKPGEKGADWKARIQERLDQAVKDGKLTQAQADAIKAALDANVLPGGFGGHWRGGPGQPK